MSDTGREATPPVTTDDPCPAVLNERGTVATCQKQRGHDGLHVRWRNGDDIVWRDADESPPARETTPE